jgi:hypothetical protein
VPRHDAPPPGYRGNGYRADGRQAWRKLDPQRNRSRKGVKDRCGWRYPDGSRCRGGLVPYTGLCGPHLELDDRVADAALVRLADAFGTSDDPVTVRLVAQRQPEPVADLLYVTGRDLAAGARRTRRWIARVRKATARRATQVST